MCVMLELVGILAALAIPIEDVRNERATSSRKDVE